MWQSLWLSAVVLLACGCVGGYLSELVFELNYLQEQLGDCGILSLDFVLDITALLVAAVICD